MVTARLRRNRETCPVGYRLGGCLTGETDTRFGTPSAARRSTNSLQIAALNRRLKHETLDWEVCR
jgi:hypothetical protein